MGQLVADLVWLLSQWWFWVGVTIIGLGIWLAGYLFGRRTYKMENGRLMVRHGRLGEWMDVKEHMSQDHDEGE